MKTLGPLSTLIALLTTVAVGNAASDKTLIVVSLPAGEMADYYRCVLGGDLQPICNYIKDYARAAKEVGDEFMVIYSKDSQYNCLDYDALDDTGAYLLSVAEKDSLDVWMRDFGMVFPYASHYPGANPVKFKYRPGYLKEDDAKFVDDKFRKLISDALSDTNFDFWKDNMVLDGGNVVDTDHKAILTWRTKEENPFWSKKDITDTLQHWAPTDDFKFCMLPNPTRASDTTGHSDGLCSFLDENTLVVADYGDGKFQTTWDTIKECFPSINMVYMENYEYLEGSPFGDVAGCPKVEKFTSATGSTINLVKSKKGLYVPVFGSRNFSNAKQLDVIKKAIGDRKKVVEVDTGMLSHMGGSVRCMSWQIASDDIVARELKAWSDEQVEKK